LDSLDTIIQFMDHTDILIKLALAEDLGLADAIAADITPVLDITTAACIPIGQKGSAVIIAREKGVLAGQDVAKKVFKILDPEVQYTESLSDGDEVHADSVIASIAGPYGSILAGERMALNFLQRLSGIATMTREITSMVAPYGVRVLDTRKTTPGYRMLEKSAIRMGGGYNHRMGLYDQFLIKNNHIDALGGDVALAIRKCRNYRNSVCLKVEVRNRDEITSALSEKPDGLLLDNFSSSELSELVSEIRLHEHGKMIRLEASGGITPANVMEYAKTGIDEISLGFLTHSTRALDISLRHAK
jgi:nicotinate-nucleotide pyrophosphorylase (carboxylating)